MTEFIKVEVGICKTCRHYSEQWDDPGAQDCSLSPGKMLIDVCCAVEEKLPEGCEKLGKDKDNQCPLWEIPKSIYYCQRHKEWVWGECGKCMEEAFK